MADLKSKLLPSTSGHYYTKIKGMQAQAVVRDYLQIFSKSI